MQFLTESGLHLTPTYYIDLHSADKDRLFFVSEISDTAFKILTSEELESEWFTRLTVDLEKTCLPDDA